MILEQSLQHEKDARDTSADTPEAKPTTKDVFRDPKNESRFAKMLTHEGPEGQELARIMAAPKEAKPGDLQRIETMRAQFAERINGANTIAQEISIDTIDNFIGAHPDLQNVINAVGKQGAVDMIHKWLPEIAADDPARFAEIQSNFQAIVAYREKNPVIKQFKKLCEENNVQLDVDEFARVMQNPDKSERAHELRSLVRSEMGVFRKTISAISRITTVGMWSPVKATAADFEGMKKKIEKGKAELSQRKQELGKTLGMMFDENDDVREALFLEMQGMKAEPKPILGLKEARSRISSEADALSAWDKEKKSAAYQALPDNAAKQKHLDDWQQKNVDHAKGEDKGGGIWGAIASALIDSLFNTPATKAKFAL